MCYVQKDTYTDIWIRCFGANISGMQIPALDHFDQQQLPLLIKFEGQLNLSIHICGALYNCWVQLFEKALQNLKTLL